MTGCTGGWGSKSISWFTSDSKGVEVEGVMLFFSVFERGRGGDGGLQKRYKSLLEDGLQKIKDNSTKKRKT